MIKQTACGIFLRGGKLLLGKRFNNEDCYAGCWDLPSGHIEKNETAEDALKREMKEELGVEVTGFEEAFLLEEDDPTSGNHYIHNFFRVNSWNGQIKNSGEVERLGWFTYEEAKKMKTTLSNCLEKCFIK